MRKSVSRFAKQVNKRIKEMLMIQTWIYIGLWCMINRLKMIRGILGWMRK